MTDDRITIYSASLVIQQYVEILVWLSSAAAWHCRRGRRRLGVVDDAT